MGRHKKLKGFQKPTGTHDILAEDWFWFDKVFKVVKEVADFYHFARIETPILEQTELFTRGIGLTTDIVEKQMYSFRTKGGDNLSLRPEGTATIVRAYLEQGMQSLPQPVKLWYFGPFFRYEHPQQGRFRQFWQFGFESFGSGAPITTVQIIQLFYNILRELGFKNLAVEINNIGDSQCRPYFKKLLVRYLRTRIHSLCQNCKRRIKENPFRILDCKEERCSIIKNQAPQIIDHLCEVCHNHLKEVLEFLDEINIPYFLNPYLVRGLDYYTKTVFEIFSEAPKEINERTGRNALVGGGCYDALIKLLGGKETPACGAAAGIERIVGLLKETHKKSFPASHPAKIFLAQIGSLAKKKSLKLIEQFREAKVPLSESLDRDSLRAQLKIANSLGVKYVLILGEKEALDGTVILKEMETGKQVVLKSDKVVKEVKKKI